jgi:hypothetical protein
MSTLDSNNTSAPSAIIVSDDAGNLDASWLSENYPSGPPKRVVLFDWARTLTDALVYTPGAGAIPNYRDENGFIVPAKTDMAGNQLPRFTYSAHGASRGLLIEPASSNLLAYDRVGLTSGIATPGCTIGGSTRLSVDGVSQIQALVTTQTDGPHGVSLLETVPSTGSISFSCALYSPTQRYYLVTYSRAPNPDLQIAVIDTELLTIGNITGNSTGYVVRDEQGWVWVYLQLGYFDDTCQGSITVQCTLDDGQTTDYQADTTSWFVDALQIENVAQPTSPIFATVSGVVTRGADGIQSTPAQPNSMDWLNSFSGAGTLILEGHLPDVSPAAGTMAELCRFYLDANNYLVLGYFTAATNQLQLGVYLTVQNPLSGINTTTPVATNAATIVPGGFFKVGLAYSTIDGALTFSGFAVNGRTGLSSGKVGVAMPNGVTRTLNLSSGNLPYTVSALTGYDQALNINQLKYLTAV